MWLDHGPQRQLLQVPQLRVHLGLQLARTVKASDATRGRQSLEPVAPSARLLFPVADAGDLLDRHPDDEAGWWVEHRREPDARADVGVRQLLKEFRCAALGHPRSAAQDQVV